MTGFLLFIEKHLVRLIIMLLGSTLTFREHDPRPMTPCIYVFWHRHIIPLMYLYRNSKAAIIISHSNEGEIIAGPAELLGYKVVRGSSTRGGTEALQQIINLAGEYSPAITPDGPLGPPERLKKSLLFIAYYTKLPLIPMAVHVDRAWLFPTWDIFSVPKPKSLIDISYGAPIYVSSKDEVKNGLEDLQLVMDRLQFINRERSLNKKGNKRSAVQTDKP